MMVSMLMMRMMTITNMLMMMMITITLMMMMMMARITVGRGDDTDFGSC